MKSLHLEVDPENSSLLHIFWEGQFCRSISKQLIEKHLNKLRACTDRQELLTSLHGLEVQMARKEGIRSLSRKGYFGPELKEKLRSKGLSEEAVEEALLFFEKKGYIDDVHRVEAVIRREAAKGHGPQHIYQMLKLKRVPQHEIDKYRSLIQEGERASLQAYLKKKSMSLQKGEYKEYRKRVAQLLRRGYSYETIQSVVGES